jgi:dodecin
VSLAEATRAAVAEAAKTIRHMDWSQVAEESGRIKGGKVEESQVRLKIGFKIERYRGYSGPRVSSKALISR